MNPLQHNLPLFIAFRVLFNARFYYPVLGILFLDLGLTLGQYALLNVVWAVTIVVAEVPSGALADLLGRKRMVVLAAVGMVVELSLLAFAPSGVPALLFPLLVLNRICGGIAEASASGADEALAYESIPDTEREIRWPKVLVSLMRWQSAAFFFAMLTGAALYDASFLNGVGEFFGLQSNISSESSTRFPVYLTLFTALLCFGVTCFMTEPDTPKPTQIPNSREIFAEAWKNIWLGAITVFSERRIFFLILAGLIFDSFARLFLTLMSNYNRLIELPEAAYGLVGSCLALLGFAAAPIARSLVLQKSAFFNFSLVACLILLGLSGATLATPWWGVWIIFPLGFSMSFLQFFLSNYLNTWTESKLRATVLSFKGVALNLGYGTLGLLFALLTAHLKSDNPSISENVLFHSTLSWLPPCFLLCLLLFAWVARWSRRA